MTSYICPFARYVEQTFYPNGSLKTEKHFHPISKLTKIGIPMAAFAAVVNGLAAYLTGTRPREAMIMGSLFTYEFCVVDLICHQLKGEKYHDQSWRVAMRNVIQLSINFFFCSSVVNVRRLSYSTFTKAWVVLLPFAIAQSLESFYFHKES